MDGVGEAVGTKTAEASPGQSWRRGTRAWAAEQLATIARVGEEAQRRQNRRRRDAVRVPSRQDAAAVRDCCRPVALRSSQLAHVTHFENVAAAADFLVGLREPGGCPPCPKCGMPVSAQMPGTPDPPPYSAWPINPSQTSDDTTALPRSDELTSLGCRGCCRCDLGIPCPAKHTSKAQLRETSPAVSKAHTPFAQFALAVGESVSKLSPRLPRWSPSRTRANAGRAGRAGRGIQAATASATSQTLH